MQSVIYFFIVFAMSLATDVSFFNFYDYGYEQPEIEFETDPIPWKFSFTSSDRLYMVINLVNKPPRVTMMMVAYESDIKMSEAAILRVSTGENGLMFYRPLSGPKAIINLYLYTSSGLCTSMKVAEGRLISTLIYEETGKEYKYNNICFKGEQQPCVLEVYFLKHFTCKVPVMQTTQKPETQATTANPFTSLENNKNTDKPYVPKSQTLTSFKITASVTGPPIVTRTNENVKITTPLTDLVNNNTTFVSNDSSPSYENMTTSTNSLVNNTETNNQQQPPQSKVLIYVIPSIIVMCITTLASCIGVKKYCHRKSHPVETMEVNTYSWSLFSHIQKQPFYFKSNTVATANEVVYADLSLMHGDSQPPRREEESPYAEIIGVLKPH